MLALNEELDKARTLLIEAGLLRAAKRLELKGKARKKARYRVVFVGRKVSPSAAFRIERNRIAASDGGLEQKAR